MANSLLYDRNHLPRSAPAPDCVRLAPGPVLAAVSDVLPGAPSPLPVAVATPAATEDLAPELPMAAAVLPSKRTLEET